MGTPSRIVRGTGDGSITTYCKPGDLAVIIKEDPGCEIDIGRIVIVSDKGLHEPRFGWMWVVKPLDQGPMLCINDETEALCVATSDVYQPDDWLRPVKFDKADDADQDASWFVKRS